MAVLSIAGTDTDAGKTWVTIALAAYWQRYCARPDGEQRLLSIFKLMQTGTGDWELYNRLFGESEEVEVVVPLRFSTPVAPPIAAAKEGKNIDLGKVWQEYSVARQKSDLILMEFLGGLGSPITNELTVGNLAADWRLPTVLVVPVRLGAIAHTVANVALARSLNLDLKGIILNCTQSDLQSQIEDLTPVDLIQFLTQIPVIGILPYVEDITDGDRLASAVADWDLELIMPKPRVFL